MAEELRFHMTAYAEDLRRSGVAAEEAARLARIEFGGVNSVTADCRSVLGLAFFDELARQMRYTTRLLRKTPGFTATAVLILGLCLGAHLTIFAVIDSILIRPLPFPNAGRLVTVFNTYPKAGVMRDGSSLTNYYERRGKIAAFQSLSIYRLGKGTVGEQGWSERDEVTQVSPEFFATLGVKPAEGRAFTEAETSYGTDGVAIVSNAFSRRHFTADSHAIGKELRLDGRVKTVIGVLPAGFQFLSSEAPIYVPLASRVQDRTPRERHSGGNVTQMIARLMPGASLERAQAQIDRQNHVLEADDPEGKAMADAGFRSLVVGLHSDHVAEVRPVLLLLEAGVILLLLIGGVNLANLLLIRAGSRTKELSVRQALGAGWIHVVSEVVVEIAILALAGGLLGLVFGTGGIYSLRWLGVDQLPLGSHVAFDGRLAASMLAATVLMCIALSIPIAWFHLKHHLANGLQVETRSGTTNRGAQMLRHGFVVAQISLAFVLLAGAGLLGLSLKSALSVYPGFRADHLMTGQVSLVGGKYPSSLSGLSFVERLTDELRHQPGVVSTGVSSNLPFSGYSGKSAATVKGYAMRPGESPQGIYSYGVGGDYFHTMGFTLREGRFLVAVDSRRVQRVCVVDENFARFYWPHASALGHLLFQGSGAKNDDEAFTVVGVVSRVKQAGLTDDGTQGAVYYPYIYRPDNNFYIALRASLPPDALASTLRRVVRQIDPELPVSGMQSMDARIEDSLLMRKSPALLAGFYSLVALLLTAIGTYGVLSYAVALRRREIGLRMALGARPDQIRGQFLSLAGRLLLMGIGIGFVGAWVVGRAMQSILFHVPAFDVTLLIGAAIVIAIVSLGACLVPAQRAARTSPMRALAD